MFRNFLLNAEKNSFAQHFANHHGPSICAMAFRVKDANAAYNNPMMWSQATGGSTAVRGYIAALQQAGAQAREMLVGAAMADATITGLGGATSGAPRRQLFGPGPAGRVRRTIAVLVEVEHDHGGRIARVDDLAVAHRVVRQGDLAERGDAGRVLELDLGDVVLDDVADAHDPAEPAALHHGEVPNSVAGQRLIKGFIRWP